MANKHLSEDEIKYVISADSSKAQQELHQLGKSTAALRREEKARRSAMIELEATGKKNTEQYQKLKQECREYTRQIANNEEKMKKLRATLDVNAMTMNQLRKYAKELSSELNNTSKAAAPQKYAELENRLQGVNMRIEELRSNAVKLRQHFFSMESFNVMAGNIMTKLGEMAGNTLRKFTNFITDAISKSIELAESADGITHAFERIGSKDYLQSLREATKGTVTDIELMKAAVKAKDFSIPLEDLGKYLSFAQLKAQQTGQSLDYMVDSIVTGLGRKSPLILDNLGLSAAEIAEQTKKTGNFMKAVAAIVDKQLAAAGETYISAADRAAQRTVRLQNAQKQLGDELLPIKEEFADAYGQIQLTVVNTTKYLIQHRDTILELGKAILLLVTTYAAYVAGQKIAWAWSMRQLVVEKLQAAAIAVKNMMLELSVLRHAVLNKTITTSIALQKAFNIVLKLSPWGLILGAITLVVGALLLYNKKLNAAAMTQQKLNNIRYQAQRKVEEERIKIEALTKKIHDNTRSLDERKAAIAELQKIVPDYTAKLSKEGKVYDENTLALTRYLDKLKEKALAEATQEAVKDLQKQRIDLILEQTKLEDQLKKMKEEQAEFYKKNNGRRQTSSGPVAPTNMYAAMGNAANLKVLAGQLDDVNKKIKNVETTINNIDEDLAKKLRGNAGTDDNKKGTIAEAIENITQKIEALKAKRLTIKVGDISALKKIDRQIAALEKRKQFLENTFEDKKTTEKAGKQNKTAFGNSRKQKIDNLQQTYNQELNLLKQQFITRQITQEQYDNKALTLQIAHAAKILAIEEKYTQLAKNIRIKDKNEKTAFVIAQQNNELQARQAFREKELEAQQKFYQILDTLREKGLNNEQRQQLEHDIQLATLKANYEAAIDYARKRGEDETAITRAYAQAKAQIETDTEQKTQQQKASILQKYNLINFQQQIDNRKKEIEKESPHAHLTQKKYQQQHTNPPHAAQQPRLQIRQQYGIVAQQEIYNAELEQLKQHLDAKKISETEYEEAVKNLKIAKAKETFDYYAELTTSAAQALQQAEEANIDAKYDAEIEAAKNAGKDTTELEKKKANEKLKIQKKYADVNFAIKASQIIADTAVAIMKALGQLGPIAGPIAAALMATTGAAQLAAANAERQKVKKMTLAGAGATDATSGVRVATGLADGGSIDVEREQDGRRFHAAYEPQRRGFIDKPTVIVGEGGYGHSREWVASNAAVENPTVAPIIDIIDRAQRAGNIRYLDMNKVFLQQTVGRANGGTVNPEALPITDRNVNNNQDQILRRLTQVLDKIYTDGIPASVALSEIEQKQQLRDKARRFAAK